MNIAFLIIVAVISYIGSIISKLLFYFVNVKDKETINTLFLVIPFSTFKASDFLKNSILKKKISEKTLMLIEIVGILIFFFATFSFLNFITFNLLGFGEALFFVVLNLFFLLSFLYLSIHDIINLRIPDNFVKGLLLSAVFLSLVIGLYRYATFRSTGAYILYGFEIGEFGNLAAALILGALAWILVKLKSGMTKEDIFLFAFLGLVLGFLNSFVALIIISITGLAASLIYCVKIKRIKGVKVPLAPLVTFGYAISLGYGQAITDFILNL